MTAPEQSAESVAFTAWVTDAGGGQVVLLVDRNTEEYPEVGAHVRVLLIDGEEQ